MEISWWNGLPDDHLARLQRILIIAARIITHESHSVSITPILKRLHWLPVNQGIKYKLLVITLKAMNVLAPVYLLNISHCTKNHKGHDQLEIVL